MDKLRRRILAAWPVFAGILIGFIILAAWRAVGGSGGFLTGIIAGIPGAALVWAKRKTVRPPRDGGEAREGAAHRAVQRAVLSKAADQRDTFRAAASKLAADELSAELRGAPALAAAEEGAAWDAQRALLPPHSEEIDRLKNKNKLRRRG